VGYAAAAGYIRLLTFWAMVMSRWVCSDLPLVVALQTPKPLVGSCVPGQTIRLWRWCPNPIGEIPRVLLRSVVVLLLFAAAIAVSLPMQETHCSAQAMSLKIADAAIHMRMLRALDLLFARLLRLQLCRPFAHHQRAAAVKMSKMSKNRPWCGLY
jgi:hypothetical protein